MGIDLKLTNRTLLYFQKHSSSKPFAIVGVKVMPSVSPGRGILRMGQARISRMVQTNPRSQYYEPSTNYRTPARGCMETTVP